MTQPSRHWTHGAVERLARLRREPVRTLVVTVCVVLFAIAIPFLVAGGARIERAWATARRDSSVDRSWRGATARIDAVRVADGLELALSYAPPEKPTRSVRLHLDAPGTSWIATRVRIRYDPRHPDRVELTDIVEPAALWTGLLAGSALCVGAGAATLAFMLWRRRAAFGTTGPLTVLAAPVARSAILGAAGLVLWVVGTAGRRGIAGAASGLGRGISTTVGYLLAIGLPLLAFAAGALVTAWLAKHREQPMPGALGSAQAWIDRAADHLPTPSELAPPSDEERHAAGRRPGSA